MKCRCCEKEIDEENSINGVCKECNNEIMKRVKINEIVDQIKNENSTTSNNKINKNNKNASRATIFLCISFIIFNPLGLFSILAMIFGALGLSDSEETQEGKSSSIISIIGGILITFYQWFIAPTISLKLF